MDDFVPGVRRIKGPAITPADMQRSLGAVIIGTDFVLLGIVLGKPPVLPDAGEFLEIIDRDLVIRSVAGLLLVVQDRRAAHRPAGRGINPARIFLFAPP